MEPERAPWAWLSPVGRSICTQVVAALENGVSQWPKLEGRFPQTSGVKFKFDPSKPAGERVVPGSVCITDFGKRRVAVLCGVDRNTCKRRHLGLALRKACKRFR